jgi:chromosome partitioning protein
MTRKISFVNFKGGVGKTSLTVNIAAFLAQEFGQRVLLVDCDAQSNASFWLLGAGRWNEVNEKPQKSVYTVFMDRNNAPPLHQNIVKAVLENAKGAKMITKLDLLPACYELMELEQAATNINKPFYLKFYEELSGVFSNYDYIIFDCPPNVFRACQCAIFSSEEIYVPCNPDDLSYAGLSLLARKIEKFQQESVLAQTVIPNYRRAVIRGVIFNSVLGTSDYTDVITKIQTRILQLRKNKAVSADADTLPQRIRFAVKVGQTVGEHLPIVLNKKGNQGIYDDYLNLTRFIHKSPLY